MKTNISVTANANYQQKELPYLYFCTFKKKKKKKHVMPSRPAFYFRKPSLTFAQLNQPAG